MSKSPRVIERGIVGDSTSDNRYRVELEAVVKVTSEIIKADDEFEAVANFLFEADVEKLLNVVLGGPYVHRAEFDRVLTVHITKYDSKGQQVEDSWEMNIQSESPKPSKH